MLPAGAASIPVVQVSVSPVRVFSWPPDDSQYTLPGFSNVRIFPSLSLVIFISFFPGITVVLVSCVPVNSASASACVLCQAVYFVVFTSTSAAAVNLGLPQELPVTLVADTAKPECAEKPLTPPIE